MLFFAITLIAAIIGGFIGLRLKLPAGAMIGSMLAVVCLNLLFQCGYVPQDMRKIIQVCAGALIGIRMTRKDLMGLREIILPAAILIAGLILLNFSVGFILFKSSSLDLATALFASAPGGLADMSLIADEFGADAPKVAVIHTIRIMSIIGLFPVILKSFCSRFSSTPSYSQEKAAAKDEIAAVINKIEPAKDQKHQWKNFGLTMGIAAIGGTVGLLLKLPAGAMIGSMFAVLALNIFSEQCYIPQNMRKITQIVSGALIGSKMTRADVIALNTVIIPSILLIFLLIVLNIVLGVVINKICKLDLATALFASAPGGLTDMTLIADELGADSAKVAILQLVRLICVISLFPILLKFMYTFLVNL